MPRSPQFASLPLVSVTATTLIGRMPLMHTPRLARSLPLRWRGRGHQNIQNPLVRLRVTGMELFLQKTFSTDDIYLVLV